MLFPRETTCSTESDFNGEHMGARISSVFVILVTSMFGAFFPILSSRYSFIRLPDWCFFIAKFFGSGVIIATAFIHLLQPANEALSDECLGEGFEDYPYAFVIALVSIFVMCFGELMTFRFMDHKLEVAEEKQINADKISKLENEEDDEVGTGLDLNTQPAPEPQQMNPENTLENHFAHQNEHQDIENVGTLVDNNLESYKSQFISVLVLEFGIIFHSVFVGLTLATSGDEFTTLYPVIVFHQMFEGLGLGTRIAATPWPHNRRLTPWFFALAYGLTTPIAIAIGLGVRHSYAAGSSTALITNGCFDAVSAGILIYTGLVELMAHEFIFSTQFNGKGGLKRLLWAYAIMCLGTGLMALLGKWA